MSTILATSVRQYTGPGVATALAKGTLCALSRCVVRARAGASMAFLVSGRSAFTTGQVIYFAGGWP
jgi:hypothetical protein